MRGGKRKVEKEKFFAVLCALGEAKGEDINMRGLLGSRCSAKNNEEYRVVLKKRQVMFCLCTLAGIVVAGIALFLYYSTRAELSDYRLGYLVGLGGGLALGSVAGLISIRRRLADEEKLKQARLQETDERELEVDSRALRATAKTLLAVLYVLLVAAGFLESDELLAICTGLIAVFLLSYAAFRKYYGTKI